MGDAGYRLSAIFGYSLSEFHWKNAAIAVRVLLLARLALELQSVGWAPFSQCSVHGFHPRSIFQSQQQLWKLKSPTIRYLGRKIRSLLWRC
jgi:hypothetical protein